MASYFSISSRTARSLARLTAAAAGLVLYAAPARAQLDPLLFLKTMQPNVLIVMDTSNRMQRDAPTDPSTTSTSRATSNFYDTFIYPYSSAVLDTPWEDKIGVRASNTTARYRRKYNNLDYVSNGSGDKFSTSTISTVTDQSALYNSFEAATRLSLARASLSQVIRENVAVARFGLIKMRQNSPAFPTQGNSGPVVSSDIDQTVVTEAPAGKWKVSRATVSGSNGVTGASAALVKADVATANADVYTVLAKNTQTAGALLPASNDDLNTVDAPVKHMLDDAKTEAQRLITADALACRNTVVVLIVGGGEGNSGGNADPAAAASGFLNVQAGHRVPIYVIAIAPPASDVAQLQAIAANSGGQYYEITKAQIDAALASPVQVSSSPAATVIVPEIVKAANIAVQHAFASSTDVNTAPTAQLPFGPSTESQTTSPIIGTVNLQDAVDIGGATLSPDPSSVKDRANNVIPQRSNLMITTGFSLPGFDMQMRGFRTYKPVSDATQPSGWKFVADGTRLWVASTPAPDSRNLYTALPDGTMIALTTANAATLAPYMNLNVTDATSVINNVRGLSLGAVLDSTPAVMNGPSLDPPPDDTYPAFSNRNKDRRSIIFVGTSRGILEGIDARLGKEVWGFIPFNLLPKLRTLRDGQSVGSFDYFVDGSPKVADVKLADGTWHTYMFVGEGPGGTFYQTFDVTMDAMSVTPTENDINVVLSYFSSPTRIPLVWTYPLYSDFDYTFSSATMPYGDLKTSATVQEKTVGHTWSDPAIGQVKSNSSPYVVLVGSGFFPRSAELQANRTPTLAGTTFYMLNAGTGALLATKDVGSDGLGEAVSNCVTANDCSKIKNALQSDPVATGPSDSRFITMAYMGDLDGRVWRFDIDLDANNVPIFKSGTNPTRLYTDALTQPIFSSMATVNVGGTQQYIFFGTGSDLLASNGVSQSYRLIGVLDNGATGAVTFNPILLKVDNTGADEKVTAFPAVAGDIVFFTTTTTTPGTCAAPSANLYALTFIGGAAYDTNNDGSFNSQDKTLVKTVAGARATAPFIVDQHLVFTAGGNVQMFGDPQDYNNGVGQAGVRILSWREIR